MKSLSNLLPACALVLLLLLAGPSAQGKSGWMDNQQQALTRAKDEKKLLLMYFTGSDWCPVCVKLDQEVFDTAEFKAYAAQHLVLLELDFPERKPMSVPTRIQNETLRQRYGVESFPTFVVLNENGKPLGMFYGSPRGGTKAFIAAFDKLRR